ncbi:MAG: hypothetical protein KatS3mg051_1937 [Anaerolineae bacterium]|nr:MAG: hypothetical protein KatS3mg051_1937 [Anaerolineae bacterium]
MYLLDLPTHEADLLIVVQHQDARWQVAWNNYDVCGMVSDERMRRVIEYGAGWLLQVGAQSWLATRTGHSWAIEVCAKWQGNIPDRLTLSRTLGYLATLQVHDEAVHWHKGDGFQPRAGALGLTKPEYDYLLRWPDGTIRRIVVGTRTPFGRGVFRFDGLTADEHGNPHPKMLYLVKE